MSPKSTATFTLVPSDSPVEFAAHELDGKLYVFAANKSDHPQKASLSSKAFQGSKAKVLYEDHTVQQNSDSFADDFQPFGVHVYEFVQ
jgi:hypothetical protein